MLTPNSSVEQVLSESGKSLKAMADLMPLLIAKIATLDKKDQQETCNALLLIKELASKLILRSQPYVLMALPAILECVGDKKALKETAACAEDASKAIMNNISPNAIRQVLPILFTAMDAKQRWQTRVVALKAISQFGDHAPEELGFALPDVIPEVSKCVIDLKKEVCDAAEQALTVSLDVVGNRDIEHLTKDIVRSITHPEDTEEIMHKLAGVTFVQSVESPALAMVTPLLIKGLNSRNTATVRQSAVIIDNMSKLVDDPMDVGPFMPLLLPVVVKAAQVVSDPEARGVVERAEAQLNRLNADLQEALTRQKHVEFDAVYKVIASKIQGKDCDEYLAHVAHLCCSLMHVRKFDVRHWKEIQEHLAVVNEEQAKSSIAAIRSECEAMAKPLPGKDDVDDDGEDLCNCDFTLAYGTKILLHNTKLRLKRGGKYGLLGGNDSGKTTLMRAIANGSVEGFPDPAEVKTVFVEADIVGELSHLSCIDYILSDPALQGMDRDHTLKVMASVGFTTDGKARPTHPVSSLSGGWRMKLAMARAMLQNADILLLDEPTNHLVLFSNNRMLLMFPG